jgi:hypothetical protein
VSRALGTGKGQEYQGDAGAQAHESLRGFWHALEILPMNLTLDRGVFFLPLGARRNLAAGGKAGALREVTVHQSVLDRKDAPGSRYDPKNLGIPYRVERWSGPPGAPSEPKLPACSPAKRIVEIALSAVFVAFLLFALLAGVSALAFWLSEASRWQVLVIFAGPFGVLLAGGAAVGRMSGLSKHAGKAMERLKKPLIHERPGGYDLADLAAQDNALQEEGVRAYRRMLCIDLIFPIVYGPVLFAALCLARDLVGSGIPCLVLALLPAIVVIADWIENITLLVQTRPDGGGPSAGPVRLASCATAVKYYGYMLGAVLPPLAWIVAQLWIPLSRVLDSLLKLLA